MAVKNIDLNPKLSFAVALLYMASADGVIDHGEITHLSNVMHGDMTVLLEANKYVKNCLKKGISFNDFLYKSNELLNDEQKECIIINIIDMMISDKHAEVHQNEEKLLIHIIHMYGVDKEKYLLYKELISKKNNHAIFSEVPHDRRSTDK